MLTQEQLKAHFIYEQDTGFFIRKFSHGRFKAGDLAGGINGSGYVNLWLNKKLYGAHRLAFLYMMGEFPHLMVDHINGVRHDNRWGNLRLVDFKTNGQNRRTNCTTKSGLKGAYKNSKGDKYNSVITVRGKRITLGSSFQTAQEAHEAYCQAAEKYFGDHARFE